MASSTKPSKQLKPKDLQCFLVEQINKIASNRDTLDDFEFVGKVTGDPGNVVSRIQHGNKTDEVKELLDLCPDIHGLLTPYIKIYRVVYEEGNPMKVAKIQEMPFKNFVSPDDISALSATGTRYGRQGGAGIQSFSWELKGVNPAEVNNNITAKLVMYFQSLYDLFRYNIKDGKYQAGIEDQPGYLDLIINSASSFDTSGEGEPHEPISKGVNAMCEDIQHELYKGVNYRIKAVVGWATPPGLKSLKIPGYTKKQLENLEKAIEHTRSSLFLQAVRHNITFNEDGSLEMTIEYHAGLTGKLTAANADIFVGHKNYEENKKAISDQKKTISDLEKKENDREKHGDSEAAAKAGKDVDKENDMLIEMEKKDRLDKYQSLLAPLYEGKKIYSIAVAASELYETPWGDLSPEEREERAKNAESKEFEIVPADQADMAFLDEVAARVAQNNEDDPGGKIPQPNDGKDVLLVNFFYLGDFIDSILKRLKHLHNDKNFQLILGETEVIDPLQAFQVDTISIKCPGAPKAIAKKLSEIDPLRYNNLNDIIFKTNIANIPISLDKFQSWFISKIINNDKTNYFLLHFICDICLDLISDSLNSVCYEGEFNFALNFAMNTFDVMDDYSGKEATVEQLADSKFRVDTNPTDSDPDNQPVSTFIMYSRDSKPKVTGDYEKDVAQGVYHYFLGAACGLIKNVSFSRMDQPHLREAKLQRFGALGAEQLRELYILNLAMVGNALHKNGQYIYFNPTALGAGDPTAAGSLPNLARMMGLGGYFMITSVTHNITQDEFTVQLKGYQEGINTENNSVVGINKPSETEYSPDGAPESAHSDN